MQQFFQDNRRPWLVAGALALVLVVALGALFKSAVLEAYVRGRAVPALSRKLGRPIELGTVETSFFPGPAVDIRSIAVAGLSGEPPLVAIERARASAEFWRFLRTFGRDVRLTEVELVAPTLNLVRTDRGFSASEVMQRASESPPEVDLSFSRVVVKNGTVLLVDQTTGSAQPSTAISSIDATIEENGPARWSLKGQAAVASSRSNVQYDVSFADRPRAVAGTISASDVELVRFRSAMPGGLGALVASGLASVDAKLSTTGGGLLAASGKLRFYKLVLRGGHPANGGADLLLSVSGERPESFSLRAEPMTLEGPGIDLAGTTLIQGAPFSMRLDLAGKLLDVDELLSPREPGPQPVEAGIVPGDLQRAMAEASVMAGFRIERVVDAELAVSDVVGEGKITDGVLTLTACSAKLYGGTAEVSGTEVDFRPDLPAWHVLSRLRDVDVGAATAQVAKRRPLEGRLVAEVDLRGEGNDWPSIRPRVTGHGDAEISSAALTIDLGAQVAASLRSAFAHVGLEDMVRPPPRAERTPLAPLKVAFAVEKGWIRLLKPVRVQAPFGSASLGGRVGLDGRLDLRGTLAAGPELVAKLSGGLLKSRATMTLPIEVAGTLSHPEVKLTVDPFDVGRKFLGR